MSGDKNLYTHDKNINCSGEYVLCGQRNGAPCYSRAGGGAIYFDGSYWKLCRLGAGSDTQKWNFSQKGSPSHVPLGQWQESLRITKEKKRDYSALKLSKQSVVLRADAEQAQVAQNAAGGISLELFLQYAAANSSLFTEIYNKSNLR